MLLESASELQTEGPLSPAELSTVEWIALWRRCTQASVFQSPAWVHAWWARFGGSHPMLLAFRNSGNLIGVAPLFLWPEERRILFMGTGITDSLDLLAEPGWEGVVAETTMQWLESCHNDWDCCDFQQVQQNSPLLTVGAPPQWVDSTAVQDTTPVLKLPVGIKEMPRAAELAYLHRRLAKEGILEIVTATRDNIHELLSILADLHGARWALREEKGVLSDNRVIEFHCDAARALLRLGALRLFALTVAGKAVAAYYGFQHAGRATYYLGGFHPDWKRFSVGTMIVGHAIAEAIREGASEFDFGRGQEPYKYRWGAEDRFTYRRELRA